MQVAIIAPSPVPFVWGGAENLYAGLQSFINAETRHACEIIKVPVAESNFSDLLDSYMKMSKLDVSYFDRIISTKYPSWMSFNNRHICYMLHKLRGLYDTYHFIERRTDIDDVDLEIKLLISKFRSSLENGKNSHSKTEKFIDNVLRNVRGREEEPQFRFPGPLIRHIIHLLDSAALSGQYIDGYAAISQNVANRAGYFPSNARVSVLYPPPRTSNFRCGADDYFFTMSRLDSPKRIDLLISAFRRLDSDIPLVIAGTGPEEPRLRALAEGDPKIVFVGSASDEQAAELYANALAVPFIPYDEDYGYITIEAMKSGKPVITAADSGGPLEFVENAVSGLICEPSEDGVLQALTYMSEHRQEAREMGKNAQKRVATINWNSVVEGLLGHKNPDTSIVYGGFEKNDKPRLVVLVTFPVFPALGGGQTRILNLYKSLARYFNIQIVCLDAFGAEQATEQVCLGLTQIRVPKSAEHQAFEVKMASSVDWHPVTDIAAIDGWQHTPELSNQLRNAAEGAAAVIISHPYLYLCFKALSLDVPVWYEAHNVELTIKKEILAGTAGASELVARVSDVEQACWHEAELVFVCADTDLVSLEDLYGVRNGNTVVVPNGVDISGSIFVAPSERRQLRIELGLNESASVLFVGSWHEPNIVAAKHILEFAQALPTVNFYVVGSVGQALGGGFVPENVYLLGVVSDEVKELLNSTCDIALNPMETGSGSNLKMFDYMSSGIPIISTSFGARGIADIPGEPFYCESDILDFPQAILKMLVDLKEGSNLSHNARSIVEKYYDWNIIADNFSEYIQKR